MGNFLVNSTFDFNKINFADNLKSLCCYVFDINLSYFYDPILKETLFVKPVIITSTHIEEMNKWINFSHDFKIPTYWGGAELLSPRHMLQFVGADMIRRECSSYHVDITIADMKKHERIVSCDVRFPDELEAMCNAASEVNADCFVICVERSGYKGDFHISENMLLLDDCIKIVNNGTLKDLNEAFKAYVSNLLN